MLSVLLYIILIIILIFIIISVYVISNDNSQESFSNNDLTDQAKIIGAVSYLDKPDHVYLVDMDGAHDYIFEDGKLKSTGEIKYLGSIIPIEKIDEIDAVTNSPIPGEFMHLAFNNKKQEIYHYNPTEQKIEDTWTYKSKFNNKIHNVVAAWQSNITRPNFDKLFVFDGENVWLVRINNTFEYSNDSATKDPRFSFLAEMYKTESYKPRGIAPIWAITPRVDVDSNIVIFTDSKYLIYSVLKQIFTAKLPLIISKHD